MIGYLCGNIIHKDSSQIILEVGGIGYQVQLSTNSLSALPTNGQEAKIFTYLQVRDDILQLFGFVSLEEKELFEHLISINKVGPKLAIGILSSYEVNDLKRAIATEDLDLLSSISGIGRKTAQRLILELKEKLAVPDLKSDESLAGSENSPISQVREALKGLGYTPAEIAKALEKVGYEVTDWEKCLRDALRELGS